MSIEVLRILKPAVAYYGPARNGGLLQDGSVEFSESIKALPTVGAGLIRKLVSYVAALVMTASRVMAWKLTGSSTVVVYGSTVFALPLAVLSLLPKVKTIIHLHETGTGRNFLDSLLFRFATLADAIVCVSHFHETEVRKRLSPSAQKKIHRIYNCGSVSIVADLRANRYISFIYVGGATRRKGIRVIANVARKLASHHDLRWQLCLSSAGRVDWHAIDALSELSAVHLEWDVRDVSSYLRHAQVAVFPTVPALCEETFGLVLIEAALCGCDIVASRSGAYTEILGALKVGTTIPGSTENDLVDALASCLPPRFYSRNIATAVDASTFSRVRMWQEWSAVLDELDVPVPA
jgi:glycosyltransferase involved in cell wall biosynthesis